MCAVINRKEKYIAVFFIIHKVIIVKQVIFIAKLPKINALSTAGYSMIGKRLKNKGIEG